MSEYQYYEFQILDRRLSPEEIADVRSLSSRAVVTPTSAVFVYHWGDFRGDPLTLMRKYFDAMVYVTNWGTRQLMFRFPSGVIPERVMQTYQYDTDLKWIKTDDHAVFSFEYHDEIGDSDWLEGEGQLAAMVPLRTAIMSGDYRSLYLAWLKIMEGEYGILEEDEDFLEPPVPPNLTDLSPFLVSFINFFEIDSDLIAVAAQASEKENTKAENLPSYLQELTDTEKLQFLERVLNGEPHVGIALAQRLREIANANRKPVEQSSPRRSLHQLVTLAKHERQRRIEAANRKAEEERAARYEWIAQNQDALWDEAVSLVETRQSKNYEPAVGILVNLHALAVYHGRTLEFKTRVRELQERFPTLTAFRR